MGQVASKSEANCGTEGEQGSFKGTDCLKKEDPAKNKSQRQNSTASPGTMDFNRSVLKIEDVGGSSGATDGGRIKSEPGVVAAATATSASSSSTAKENKTGGDNRRRRRPSHRRSPKPSNVGVGSGDPAPAASSPQEGGDRESTAVRAGNEETEMEIVSIFIAPPEKWAERIEGGSGSDQEMEDGEIGSDDDGGGGFTSHSWAGNSVLEKRCPPPVGNNGNVLKRRKVEVMSRQEGSGLNSGRSQSCRVNNRCGSRKEDLDNQLVRYASSVSVSSGSSSDMSNNEDHFINHQQAMLGAFALDRTGRDEEASESLLVPLFKEVIDSERRKKTELEDENKRLKSLLAKASAEKEQTFQLLRKSNKKLAEVTDASAVLEKKVEELNTQLDEKNALIRNLKRDTCVIRGVVSRMNRSFEEPSSRERDPTLRHEGGKGQAVDRVERHSASRLKTSDRQRSDRDDRSDKDPKPTHAVTNGSSPSKVTHDHRQETKEQDKQSPCKKPNVSPEEEFILSKLKDLRKWAYAIKDIKKVDGKWRCPECGDSKFTLLATAAHARDKHVWKIGAGLSPRLR